MWESGSHIKQDIRGIRQGSWRRSEKAGHILRPFPDGGYIHAHVSDESAAPFPTARHREIVGRKDSPLLDLDVCLRQRLRGQRQAILSPERQASQGPRARCDVYSAEATRRQNLR